VEVPLLARRVFFGLILVSPLCAAAGWFFTDPAQVVGAHTLAACVLSVGAFGLLVMSLLAAITGWKGVLAGNAAPTSQADAGYRALWAAAALPLGALVVPGYLVLAALAQQWPFEEALVFALFPYYLLQSYALPTAGALAVLGMLAAAAEPEGHGQPPVPMAETTEVDVDYAAKLATRKEKTALEVRETLEAADAQAQRGEVKDALTRVEDLIERLGEHHPETPRLAEKAREFRKQLKPDRNLTEGGGPS
jgi:hypothetical protein